MRSNEKTSGYQLKSTTILAIKKGNKVAIAGDGQVSLGDTILKQGANKIRRLYHGKVIVGFAGGTADAFTLLERFEIKLEAYTGDLGRASVELAKDWRSDRMLRRLDALLIVANKENIYLLSGEGDVIEPDDGIAAIGSGGPFALAAARALLKHTKLSPADIVKEAMTIAASICIFTNDQIIVEELS